MIRSNIELANHICNEVHGLDFDMVLERIEKSGVHREGIGILPEQLDKIVEEFRTFYTGELDY